MSKILNFGSLNIDYVYTMDQIVTPGETQASLKRGVFPGGKGLNQSVACARAGAEVWHAGALGQGDCSVLTGALEGAGVHTEFLKTHDVPPGHTVIQVDRSGQNCIILYGGANQSLRRDEIDDTLAHFGAGDVMLLQNEVNELGYLIERGSQRGLKICFNLSPFKKELLDLPLERCALLAVNEVEASGITGLSAQSSPEDLIKALASPKGKAAAAALAQKARALGQGFADPRYLFCHCSERALLPQSVLQWQQAFGAFGLSLIPVPVACCGMAGLHGHLVQNLDESRRVWEQNWKCDLEKRPYENCLATGYSCRSQSLRMEGKALKHPLDVICELMDAKSAEAGAQK